jgi:hypothetical protein
LLFKVFGPAIPELRLVEDGIENSRSIPATMLPAMAN